MKDKLRELLGELMSACEMIGYATSGNERANHRATRDKIKAELLAILDAEGDGGAVAELVVDRDSGNREWFDIKVFDRTLPHGTKFYTHPARSGVVSDEDVRDAERLKEIVRRAEKVGFRRVRFELRFDPLTDTDLSLIDYIDAAIQGERHA